MSSAAKKIIDEVLAMPEEQREEIYDAIGASLHGDAELSPEWIAEIRRRIEQVQRGEVELLDGDAVLEELRQRYPDR